MLKEKLSVLREQLKDEEVRSISRRYFISNGFDGTLTSVGIAVGSYLSGVPSGMTVFQVGAGAAIGLATSGVWSVWEIEKAEKLSELQEVEDAMLEDLSDTELQKKKQAAVAVNAFMSGLGPTVAVLASITPFLFEGSYLTLLQATILSVSIGVMLLAGFGAYMGNLSNQNKYIAAIRMGLAGIVVAGLNIILPA